MSKSSGVVLTGLREEGGLALAEAMLSGVPVIVLANGGARTIAERAIDASRVRLVPAKDLDSAVQKLADAMTELIRDPPLAREPNLDSESFSQVLETAFRETLAESEDLDM
jgi:glycosyltransferase involved in cell wall biosynthesis